MCSCCRCVRRWNNRASQTVNLLLFIYRVNYIRSTFSWCLYGMRGVCVCVCWMLLSLFQNFKFTSSGFVIMNFRRNWSRHQNKQTKYARRTHVCSKRFSKTKWKWKEQQKEIYRISLIYVLSRSVKRFSIVQVPSAYVGRSVHDVRWIWIVCEWWQKWNECVWGNEKRSQNI